MDKEMSKEYQSRDAAIQYSNVENVIPDKVVKKIFEELQLKSEGEGKRGSPIDVSSFHNFDSLLDVGCATGYVTKQFAPYFKSVTGIDSSRYQIEEALTKNPAENINYLVGNGEAMPVPDKSVDLALFSFSAFHMDVRRVEQELNRVLKPHGLAVFYSHFIVGFDLVSNPDHPDLSAFPGLAKEVSRLWKNCLKIFKDYAVETDHALKGYFDRYKEICQGLNILNSRTTDDIESYVYSNLDKSLSLYQHDIPFFRNAIKGLGFNPVKDFRDKLKNLWKISHVDDKDINLKVTFSSLVVFLERRS